MRIHITITESVLNEVYKYLPQNGVDPSNVLLFAQRCFQVFHSIDLDLEYKDEEASLKGLEQDINYWGSSRECLLNTVNVFEGDWGERLKYESQIVGLP